MKKTFVGIGFGPIQAGLFVKEAADSGRFSEIVVSEVDAELVDAVRAAGIQEVESVGFALEIRSEQGQTLFQTENITLPLVYPEEPEEPEE